jgi:replicative DNA helicase
VSAPASQRAEEALLGAIFRDPAVLPEVIGSALDSTHFFYRPYRRVYDQIVERYYADEPIDALLVAEEISKPLAEDWKVDERSVIDKVVALKAASADAPALSLGTVIKRHHDFRELLALTERVRNRVIGEEDDPEAIAGELSAAAMKVATASLTKFETFSHGEVGRRWTQEKRVAQAAVAAGIKQGAHFGIRAIDDYTKGAKPTELIIAGGEPGVGKSAVWWTAARNFSKSEFDHSRQTGRKPIGTLIASLEMGEEPSSDRMATMIGKIEAEKLRAATLTKDELIVTARQWAAEKELPLFYNHSGHLRCSQLRAIVVEQVRKNNVGVVIVDHFRFLRPDDSTLRGNDADDEVVVFLKSMAMDLNVLVICLAHTVKTIERQDKRPRMADLRGSGMISAFADFVCFVYRPWRHATDQQKQRGLVDEHEAEMLWEKSRHSGEGHAEFYMNLGTMSII